MSQITRRIALFFWFTLCFGVLTNIAQAQTYSVLYTFTGPCGGKFAFGGVTLDQSGRIYGTTYNGAPTMGA